MYIKTQIILFLTLALTTFAQANTKFPFEQCKGLKKSYTNRVLGHLKNQSQQTECKTCEQIKSDPEFKELSNANKFIGSYNNRIPTECFLASSTMATYKKGEQSEEHYYFCETPTSKKHLPSMTGNKDDYPTRPCLTKDYTNMTSESFHYMADCMGFDSLEDKKELFALFNHESGFIINNRSDTMARCYGQLISEAIWEIEKKMYNNYKGSEIYKNALKKCPNLNEKIIVPKEILNGEAKSSNALKNLFEQNPITCRTTQDPYTCFFYSMFNIKLNEKETNSKLQNFSQKDRNPEIKDAFTEHFPITFNEILHVKGRYIEGENKDKEIDWVLPNRRSVNRFRNNPQLEVYSVKKKKIFDNKSLNKIKWIITHTSYNGGISIPITYLRPFLREQKRRIAKACTAKETADCQDRKSIKKDQPLDHKKFYAHFRKFIRYSYNGKTNRKKEVANFYKKINRDVRAIKNQKTNSTIFQRLKDLHKEENSATEDEIKNFLHGISQKCTF